jgi:hypothetical protein
MWLLYFRFDDQGQVVTMHVRCALKRTAEGLLKLAQERGLTPTSRLVEYALFGAGATIQPYTVPNFHYLTEETFRARWEKAAG